MTAGPTTADLVAALAWQIDSGADEAIEDAPINRFTPEQEGVDRPSTGTKPAVPPPQAAGLSARSVVAGQVQGEPATSPQEAGANHAEIAAAPDLDALAALMQGFSGTALREAAQNFVFSDGQAGARLMIVGEAPGAEEDRRGKPFVGRAGQLLDRMLAAIGLDRNDGDPRKSVYITNMLPWRPPGNRTPTSGEVALFLPFVLRHIQLAGPDIVLSMGNTPTKALADTATGIKRMRGQWRRHDALGIPMLATFHPAYLLRQPADKSLAWADLVAVRRALQDGPPV